LINDDKYNNKQLVILNIDKDTLYDFIASNYNKLTKEELKDVLLEYIYAVYKTAYNTHDIINELLDRWEDINE